MATTPDVRAVPVGNVRGAGKKATQAKRQLYANPLPVGLSKAPRSMPASPRTWWDRWNDWTRWLSHGVADTPPCEGWYDATTQSVWLRSESDAARLWTHGFFGKGQLSRSEPTWAARQLADKEARARGELTAEQLTQKRRQERQLLKIERARAAVRAGIQLPDGITALGGELEDGDAADVPLWQGDEAAPDVAAGVARVKGLKHFSADVAKPPVSTSTDVDLLDDADSWDHIEHFQLSMIEAFFLSAMLGCLDVRNAQGKVCC